jgi:hypothetical protein
VRIPTSVIVMSIVTAVPFGLAIRDTLKPKRPPAIDTGWTTYTPYQTTDRLERESHAESERPRTLEELASERRQRMLAALDAVHGRGIARMGSLFDGIVLGADAASFLPEAARQRIVSARRDEFFGVTYALDTGRLRGVDVQFHGTEYDPVAHATVDVCTVMSDKLRAVWGPPTDGVWLSPTTQDRARFDSDSCTLTFDRAIDANLWLSSVSPSLIGTTAAPVVEANKGQIAEAESPGSESAAYWTIDGVGAGRTQTSVEATIQSGKLTMITAITTTDAATAAQLRTQISALLGSRPIESESRYVAGRDVTTWKRPRKPTVELFYEPSGAIELSIHE